MNDAHVYHLTPLSALRAGTANDGYAPDSFEREGFLHCATRAQLLPVADDYFGNVQESVLVVELDAASLGKALVYEAPAPLPGGGTAHLLEGKLLFPHVYARVPLASMTRAAELPRNADGFVWPDAWSPLAVFLNADG